MWGKLNYYSANGKIVTFFPNDIAYIEIPNSCIEIDRETWQDCIANPGRRKVDLTTLQIIECESEAPTLTKEQKLTALDTQYQTEFDTLVASLGIATLANDADLIAELKQEYADLKTQYATERSAIEND